MSLDSQQWLRAKDILADALELPDSRRNAFVSEKCGDDPVLLAEVNSLLGHSAGLSEFAGQSAPSITENDGGFLHHSLTGMRTGAYVLGAEIGRGGMAVVYAAERADGAYRQSVAIKLLKNALASERDARRMARERQALAALDHPNIARLLDGGTSETGIPYLVMEYVAGTPIDEYCKTHNPSIRQRVQLILQVCAAIQSAHQQLLIHRDIKPSNILVTAAGVPKLLDFGIARLLESDDDHPQTQDASLFTPRYASPEQVLGQPVTLATDVYGLGLLLYEILAGTSPYRRIASNQVTTVATAIQAVLEDAPLRASALAADLLPAHVRALRGELDTILLKACAKLPRERYATVGQLGADLERWLSGEPIAAQPHSWHYLALKFVGRHRLGSALAAFALTAVTAGVIGTVIEKNRAEEQQAIAERRFNDVRKLANAMIFEVNPAIEKGPTKAREVLVRKALEYLDGLASEKNLDASLQMELAAAYESIGDIQGNPASNAQLGNVAAAEASYRRATRIRQTLLDFGPANSVNLKGMASIHKKLADMSWVKGDIQTTHFLYKQAIGYAEQLVRDAPADIRPQVYIAHLKIYLAGTIYSPGRASLNDMVAAHALLLETLSTLENLRQQHPADKPLQERIYDCLFEIGNIQRIGGDAAASLRTFSQAKAIVQEVLATNPDHPAWRRSLALMHTKVGEARLETGDIRGGLADLQSSMRMRRELARSDPLSAGYRKDVGVGAKIAADWLALSGDPTGALGLYQESVEIFAALAKASPKHLVMPLLQAESESGIARILAARGKLETAQVQYHHALGIIENLATEEGRKLSQEVLGTTLLGLGQLNALQGKTGTALDPLRRALAIRAGAVAQNPGSAYAKRNLALAEIALADAYAQLARSGKARVRTENQEHAVEHYRNGADIFDSLARAHRLSAAYADQPPAARLKLQAALK